MFELFHMALEFNLRLLPLMLLHPLLLKLVAVKAIDHL